MAADKRSGSAHPPFLDPGYASTRWRAPSRSPLPLPDTRSERTGPAPQRAGVDSGDADLTRNGRRGGEPVGERIIVGGRVRDGGGAPCPGALVEIWQANAAGRYAQATDQHDAPLDPNFLGAGRCVADARGEYSFRTVRPGAYPWQNHPNAWRPSHIHLSMFGPGLGSRLATQMYFPGDPLLPFDPIFGSVPEDARPRLVAALDLYAAEPGVALAYRFDIVLRGPGATPLEE